MIQIIFIGLLVISLLAGGFTYFNPSPKPFSPMGFIEENSGYNTLMTTNTKRSQLINMKTNEGLVEIRRQMDTVSQAQEDFLFSLKEQQRVLQDANKDVQSVLREAQKRGGQGKDLLDLEQLSSDIEGQERLLVSRGRYIVSLNDQIKTSRDLMAEERDLANADTQTSKHALQDRDNRLAAQANDLFDKISLHNQEMSERMNKICSRLLRVANDPAAKASQLTRTNDNIQRMLAQNQNNMQAIAEDQLKNEQRMQEIRDKSADAQDKMQDAVQDARDLTERYKMEQEGRRLAVTGHF